MSSIQLDFLREKRESLGLPSVAQLLPSRAELIRNGCLVGGAMLLGLVGLTGLAWFLHEANKGNAQLVDEAKLQLKSARERSEQVEIRFNQVNGANRKRATDLATLRSSAALLIY